MNEPRPAGTAVLHCRSSSGTYGPEKALAQVVSSLRDVGVDTKLLLLYRRPRDGSARHPWIESGAHGASSAEQILDPGPWSLGVARRVARIVSSSDCDILHTHDYKTNVLGGFATRRADQSLGWVATVHLHTSATRRLRMYRALDLFLLRLADRVVTVSRDQRQLLVARGIERRRVVLVPNVIDADALQALAGDPEETRSALGIDPGCRVVGLFGRLAHQKGGDRLLRAAPAVLRAEPRALFLFVGDGPLLERLESAATALGVASRVRFLGYRDDVPRIMASCDAVALPSRSEGMPVVLLEALALGRPVVASCVGGVPDVVRDGRTGLLVPADDEDALAEASIRLLRDRALAARLGQAGRVHVREHHAPRGAARRLASVYRAVTAERT